MFDEIKDFVIKNKIWFIIGGIISAVAGAVMAGLILLYFLIAVAVGLIVSVVSGFMKNKEIKEYKQQTIVTKGNITPGSCPKNENQKIYDQKDNTLYNQNAAAPPISETPNLENNQELEEYKKGAKQRITKEYVRELLESIKQNEEINKSQDICSSLIKCNGLRYRGDNDVLEIIERHFSTIKREDISKNFETAIRGDVEVLFEVLTGVAYNKANCGLIKLSMCNNQSGISGDLTAKCSFEHTILCACALYKNRKLMKYSNLDFIPFDPWDENHKHGSVLEKTVTYTSFDQNPLK